MRFHTLPGPRLPPHGLLVLRLATAGSSAAQRLATAAVPIPGYVINTAVAHVTRCRATVLYDNTAHAYHTCTFMPADYCGSSLARFPVGHFWFVTRPCLCRAFTRAWTTPQKFTRGLRTLVRYPTQFTADSGALPTHAHTARLQPQRNSSSTVLLLPCLTVPVLPVPHLCRYATRYLLITLRGCLTHGSWLNSGF